MLQAIVLLHYTTNINNMGFLIEIVHLGHSKYNPGLYLFMFHTDHTIPGVNS